MKIDVIYSYYSDDSDLRRLKSLKKLISSAKLKFEINNIILINNSSFVYLDQDLTRLMNFAEEIILIHGTNECLEFSGYKQGLTESIKYDVDGALILNDTFNFPRNFFPFLQYAFFDAMQKTDCSKKVYLGEFMHLKRDGYILNLSMRFFISTYMFFISKKSYIDFCSYLCSPSIWTKQQIAISHNLNERVADYIYSGNKLNSWKTFDKNISFQKRQCLHNEFYLSAKCINDQNYTMKNIFEDKKILKAIRRIQWIFFENFKLFFSISGLNSLFNFLKAKLK